MSSVTSDDFRDLHLGSEGDSDSPPQSRPSHLIRPHKKSRLGCLGCKKRKVKCDETHPSCESCIRREITCVYPANPGRNKKRVPLASFASRRSSSGSRRSSPGSTALLPASNRRDMPVIVVQEPLQTASGCDAIDMRILWHFLGHTCTSFSVEGGANSRPVEDLMRKNVMDQAFSIRFLYNTIMALSCLHAIETTGDDMGDPTRLLRYQDGLFEAYAAAISVNDPKTYGALLSNSLLLTALSSQTFRSPNAPDLYIIHWMGLWRGIGSLLRTINRAALISTGLEPLFYRPAMDLKTASNYIPVKLMLMILSIPDSHPDHQHVETYHDALKYLATLYQNLRLGGFGAVMKLRIITWFTYLPEDFVQLVFARDHRALVILAHYAVFLKLTTGVWWLKGVGARSVRDICVYLGPMWHAETEVPFSAMSEDDPIELARLLLDDPKWEARQSSTDSRYLRQEREVRELGLVDDQGRPVYFEPEAGTVILANPSQPDDEPVWNVSPYP